eukprot:1693420-Prymnesium_polylepis.1
MLPCAASGSCGIGFDPGRGAPAGRAVPCRLRSAGPTPVAQRDSHTGQWIQGGVVGSDSQGLKPCRAYDAQQHADEALAVLDARAL